MSPIKVLDEDLINKIAAGEVIERPASVVKELIENSLDAGATKIVVEIKNSGKDLIKISDNGLGMSEEDAQKSILRHATSKLVNEDDLFAINTLGFRGEALASIAAVSQFSLITKTQGAVGGFNLVVEGGSVISSGVIAADQGTTIEVQNLFFNTPARKKFLKTDAVELRHIIDVFTHYALINQKINFKLVHDGHELLNAPAVEEMQNNIASIYGINVARDLININYKNDSVEVKGFVSKPYQARNDKNQQAIFINKRWIKNSDVVKAVYDGFHSLLFVNKHPVFVLDILVNPETIDVNVHPQKLEVKIEQNELVCKAIFTAVREALQKNNLIPVLDVEFNQQFGSKPAKYSFDSSKQMVLNDEEKEEKEMENELPPKVVVSEHQTAREVVHVSKLPPLKILGQIHKTYFVAEVEGGMFLIDQHAVHERILYEQFRQQFKEGKVVVQNLLQAEIVEFTAAEKVIFENNLEMLEQFGFKLEHFGENTFVLKTVPLIFGRLQPKELVYDLINVLLEEKNKLDEIKEIIITRMACRSAVMAGDVLTIVEFENILRDLEKVELPFTCPHGRPTMIKTNVDELEKKFRRKG